MMLIELTKDELGLILAAVDWYELAVENKQVDIDGKRNIKIRCDQLNLKLMKELMKEGLL